MKFSIILFIVYNYYNMFRCLNCCFPNIKKDIVSNYEVTNKTNKNICVKVTEDEDDSFSSISVLDTKSLYDSTDILNKLKRQIEWNETVPFVPPIHFGIVIKVYDGDTITIASHLPYINSPLYRFSVRLNGIDCPEIKGKTEEEKECAVIAKKTLSDMIMSKMVTLKNIKTEKYGRILADVYVDNICLNDYMIEKRLAVIYDGGTKNTPSNWMSYYKGDELL